MQTTYMSPKNIYKLTISDVLRLIETAKQAELCRDLESLRKNLLTVWSEDETEPNFDEFELPIKAELLRLYGFYLTFHGRARNLKDLQLKAKDVLTRAIDIFDSENLDVKSAESKIILAFCYWNRGEVYEADALLSLVENDFAGNKIHPVYLQLQINRMMLFCWREKFDDAAKIVQELSPLMKFCTDRRLTLMFHFETAILHHRRLKYNDSIFHFNESVFLAKRAENLHLLALTYNNLSLLYLDMRQFQEAHNYSNQSLEILNEINHSGWLAHVLDSKALIYLTEKKPEKALNVIESALTYFLKGEDFTGLTEAFWTKVKCLLRLERTADALMLFAELQQTAICNIGEKTARRYAERLADEIYLLQNLPLPDEVAGFKKSRIRSALVKSNGKISKAAKILQLKNHQTLSDILKNQFPDLCEELGFMRRSRSSNKKKPKNNSAKTENKTNENIIARIVLPDKKVSFAFEFEFDVIETFYTGKNLMRKQFGIESDSVIAVLPFNRIPKIFQGQNLLISDEDLFIAGKVDYDKWVDVFFITGNDGEPFPLDTAAIVGEIVGYCPMSKTDVHLIEFSKLD